MNPCRSTFFAWCLLAPMVSSERDVCAGAIDTGCPDLQLRWDNSLRYNWAMRVDKRDPRIVDNALFDQGDALFDRGDTIANRLDLLSEFDLSYLRRYGLRVSGAAWGDTAYGEYGESNPTAFGTGAAPTSYAGNKFTPYVRRYYAGPSGELLDAFGSGVFDVEGTEWNVKAGRHAVVWGESLFGSTHSVAYSQAPADGLKSLANPGASAKETALPTNQVSCLTQISEELSLVGQVGLEWRPNRVPEGGTYFGSDGVLQGPNVNRLPAIEGRAGDLGLGLKWRPDWLAGTVGLYARQFDDKVGWLAQPAGAPYTRAVYARDIKLVGLTLAKNVGGVAVGAEVSHRSNGPLTSDTAQSAGPGGDFEGARGDTWHGLLNGVTILGPTSFYRSATLSGELAWCGLDRVTRNPQLYRAKGYLPGSDADAKMRGYADDQCLSAALSFVPVWLQVFSGIDLEMPLFLSRNIVGNAASNGGGNEGFTVWKAGLTAKVRARHQFDLAYTGYAQRVQEVPGYVFGSRVLGPAYKDKGWLSFTYQYSF